MDTPKLKCKSCSGQFTYPAMEKRPMPLFPTMQEAMSYQPEVLDPVCPYCRTKLQVSKMSYTITIEKHSCYYNDSTAVVYCKDCMHKHNCAEYVHLLY